MPLTPENLTILKSHFEANEHEFLNDRAYISEEAITERIEEVDPNWTLEILSKTARQTFGRDVSIIVTVRLTINGTSRDGVGMTKVAGKVGYKDGKNWIDLPDEKHTEVNEAEKSAATDALKRAARLFGIGRYLLATPKWVIDAPSMFTWLNGGKPVENAATSPENDESAHSAMVTSKTQKQASTGGSGGSSNWWTDNANIQKVMAEIKTSPGSAASKLKKTVKDFASADELIAAYQKREVA